MMSKNIFHLKFKISALIILLIQPGFSYPKSTDGLSGGNAGGSSGGNSDKSSGGFGSSPGGFSGGNSGGSSGGNSDKSSGGFGSSSGGFSGGNSGGSSGGSSGVKSEKSSGGFGSSSGTFGSSGASKGVGNYIFPSTKNKMNNLKTIQRCYPTDMGIHCVPIPQLQRRKFDPTFDGCWGSGRWQLKCGPPKIIVDLPRKKKFNILPTKMQTKKQEKV